MNKLIVFVLLVACLITGCASSVQGQVGKEVDKEAIPFPTEAWPEPPKFTEEEQKRFAESVPTAGDRFVAASGLATKGTYYTYHVSGHIQLPPDAWIASYVVDIYCLGDAAECAFNSMPILVIQRDGTDSSIAINGINQIRGDVKEFMDIIEQIKGYEIVASEEKEINQ